MDKKLKEQGFTLIEVMIATAIFTIFALYYVTGQGNNVLDSANLKESSMLRALAQDTVNKVILDPPELRESLTETLETTKFEDYPDYSYSIRLSKMAMPSFEQISGEEDSGGEGQNQNAIQQNIYDQVRKNFEEVLWQVEIKVINGATNNTYTLSTWMLDHKAAVRFSY